MSPLFVLMSTGQVRLCEEWLEAMDKADPGYSVAKGGVLEVGRSRRRLQAGAGAEAGLTA